MYQQLKMIYLALIIIVLIVVVTPTTQSTEVPELQKLDIASTLEYTNQEIEADYKYISLGIFVLTAYCPCVRCTGVWSAEHPSRAGTDFIQKTASGTIPKEGRTIAVDTSIIPFGTMVVINGHEYIAEDRGGVIRGNIIDIFFDCHQEALEFGRQKAEVFIKITDKKENATCQTHKLPPEK